MARKNNLFPRLTNPLILEAAWSKVRKGGDTPGPDRITFTEFEQRLDDEIECLSRELTSGDYAPGVAIKIPLPTQTGKIRNVGVLNVRDRVVHQAINHLMLPIYEPLLSDSAFAYRRGRSALSALEEVQHLIENEFLWVVRTDIKTFFDTIHRETLLSGVSAIIDETRFIEQIRLAVEMNYLGPGGIEPRDRGIVQGSPLSPLLSNIYMVSFDRGFVGADQKLIRYSDDIAVLCRDEAQAKKVISQITMAADALHLSLNMEKTTICKIADGFTFLGYSIDNKGKGPETKAIQAFHQRMEELEQEHSGCLEDLTKNLEAAIRGWFQYFRTLTPIRPRTENQRRAMINLARAEGELDVVARLENSKPDPGATHQASAPPAQEDDLEWTRLVDDLTREDSPFPVIAREKAKSIAAGSSAGLLYRELAGLLAENGHYAEAACVERQRLLIAGQSQGNGVYRGHVVSASASLPVDSIDPDEGARQLKTVFVGREGVYAETRPDGRYRLMSGRITEERLAEHIGFGRTMAIYPVLKDGTVATLALDVDIKKNHWLMAAKEPDRRQDLISLAHQEALRICDIAGRCGLSCLLEDSGRRGRHIWFFFDPPQPCKVTKYFATLLLESAGPPASEIIVDIIPNLSLPPHGSAGPCIKLPLGRHPETARRCLFIDRHGHPEMDQLAVLENVSPLGRGDFSNAVRILQGLSNDGKIKKSSPSLPDSKREQWDETLAPKTVRPLLKGCGIFHGLVRKAWNIRYLNHRERIAILQTAGFLGPMGEEFILRVMSWCVNYSEKRTRYYLHRMRMLPISCPKLRQVHTELAAAHPCTCSMKVRKGYYPTPVLLARPDYWDGRKHSPATKEDNRETPDPTSRDAVDRSPAAELGKLTVGQTTISEASTEETLDPILAAEEILRQVFHVRRSMAGMEKKRSDLEKHLAGLIRQLSSKELVTRFGVIRLKEGSPDEVVLEV
jgi:group II intron reverse transcriptase/maturase